MIHEMHLPFDRASIPAARAFVRGHLQSWSGDHDTVELLTTELATNAILHALGGFSITVTVATDRVRVEVGDSSSVIPVAPPPPPPESVSGRGLFLVSSLATRWGAEPTPAGKRIWFELAA